MTSPLLNPIPCPGTNVSEAPATMVKNPFGTVAPAKPTVIPTVPEESYRLTNPVTVVALTILMAVRRHGLGWATIAVAAVALKLVVISEPAMG